MPIESNYNCLLGISESPTQSEHFKIWHVSTLLFDFWRARCRRCGEVMELMCAFDIHVWRIGHIRECVQWEVM